MNDDSIAQRLVDLSPVALFGTVFAMLLFEGLSPLVPLLARRDRWRHGATNICLALIAGIAAVAGSALLTLSSAWATKARFGLLNLWETPMVLRFVVALLSIDFFEYLRHRFVHATPLFWRLHRVHHTDTNVDATTAIRGHPFESLVSFPYFAVIVALLGIDPLSLALRTLVSTTALAWHHSAVKLPPLFETLISAVTPTPRTHRMHHSRDVRFTDSNFGTVFTWWDRLFGTWNPPARYKEERTGLEGFDSLRAQSLWGVLRSPFDHPERSDTRADPPSPFK